MCVCVCVCVCECVYRGVEGVLDCVFSFSGSSIFKSLCELLVVIEIASVASL